MWFFLESMTAILKFSIWGTCIFRTILMLGDILMLIHEGKLILTHVNHFKILHVIIFCGNFFCFGRDQNEHLFRKKNWYHHPSLWRYWNNTRLVVSLLLMMSSQRRVFKVKSWCSISQTYGIHIDHFLGHWYIFSDNQICCPDDQKSETWLSDG